MERQHVLAAVTALLAVVTAVVLLDVLATVFFAITVAYVLYPVARWFRARGLSPWWASAATSTVGIAAIVVVSIPVAVLLFVRIGSLLSLIGSIPDEPVVVSAFGYSYEVTASQAVPLVTGFVQDLALALANAVPVLGIKLTLFGVVVFALLMAGESARAAAFGVVPPEYRDVLQAFVDRARTVLTAIYVVQAGTAFGTFLIGVPIFVLLGYQFPFTLAALSGVLQFLPVVGPSLVIGLLVAADLVVGNVTRAVGVFIVGGILVAWLPDPVIRPRLARRTGKFPGSLYFIGFTGGLFSLGVVGIIAGPLLVALLVEASSQLAGEIDDAGPETSLAGRTTLEDTLPLGWVPPPFADSRPSDADAGRSAVSGEETNGDREKSRGRSTDRDV